MSHVSLPCREFAFSASAFEDLATGHPLWHHPVLTRCRQRDLTAGDVAVLAAQMYRFSAHFSRILAAIFAGCPDEDAQQVIADNLFDELGCGDPRRAHPALFRRFTRALGISDDELRATPLLPETRALIETYMQAPRVHGYLAALGAVCYASEGIVGSLYAVVRDGVMGAAPLPGEALVFFDEHIAVDDDHARALAEVVIDRVGTPDDARRVERAVLEALDARVRFLDGVHGKLSASAAGAARAESPGDTPREPAFGGPRAPQRS